MAKINGARVLPQLPPKSITKRICEEALKKSNNISVSPDSVPKELKNFVKIKEIKSDYYGKTYELKMKKTLCRKREKVAPVTAAWT